MRARSSNAAAAATADVTADFTVITPTIPGVDFRQSQERGHQRRFATPAPPNHADSVQRDERSTDNRNDGHPQRQKNRRNTIVMQLPSFPRLSPEKALLSEDKESIFILIHGTTPERLYLPYLSPGNATNEK